MNWYAYTRNDPVNRSDPSGTTADAVAPIYVSSCPPGWSCVSGTGNIERVLGRQDGIQVATACPAVTFTVTGVGPDQAPDPTSITFQDRSDISDGGAAIKPKNFGIDKLSGKPTTAGSVRNVLSNVTLTVDWGGVQAPNKYTPSTPKGIPTTGPYSPVDVVGPKSVRDAPGNLMDVYNYDSTKDALASTRTAKVTADIPPNNVGVTCPKG